MSLLIFCVKGWLVFVRCGQANYPSNLYPHTHTIYTSTTYTHKHSHPPHTARTVISFLGLALGRDETECRGLAQSERECYIYFYSYREREIESEREREREREREIQAENQRVQFIRKVGLAGRVSVRCCVYEFYIYACVCVCVCVCIWLCFQKKKLSFLASSFGYEGPVCRSLWSGLHAPPPSGVPNRVSLALHGRVSASMYVLLSAAQPRYRSRVALFRIVQTAGSFSSFFFFFFFFFFIIKKKKKKKKKERKEIDR